MYVPLFPHDESIEHVAIAQAGDLHGSIGSWREREEDSGRVVGFRPRPPMCGRFPRTPSFSIDGATWIECDLHDTLR